MKSSIKLLELFKKTHLTTTEMLVFLVFCFLFPLGQLERIPLTGSVAVYLHEICMGIWVLITAKQHLPNFFSHFSQLLNKQSFYLYFWEWLFIFWSSLGIGLAFVVTHDVASLLYTARFIIYCYFAWSVAQKFATEHLLLRYILAMLGIWYWWLATVLYATFPDMRFLWSFGWDEHYYRMVGTLFDPAFTGILSVLTWVTIYSLRERLPRWLSWFSLLALSLSILLTYSRASYISALAMLLIIIGHKFWREKNVSHRMPVVIIGVILAAVLFLAAPRPGGEGVNLLRTETITARLGTAESALKDLHGVEWLVGKGLFSRSVFSPLENQNGTVNLTHARMPDNILVTLLTQTGLIGLLCGLVILLKWFPVFWKNHFELGLALTALLIHSQFNNSLLQPFVLLYFLLLVGSYGLYVTTRST